MYDELGNREMAEKVNTYLNGTSGTGFGSVSGPFAQSPDESKEKEQHLCKFAQRTADILLKEYTPVEIRRCLDMIDLMCKEHWDAHVRKMEEELLDVKRMAQTLFGQK
jgi:hypothetical protein